MKPGDTVRFRFPPSGRLDSRCVVISITLDGVIVRTGPGGREVWVAHRDLLPDEVPR